MSKRSRILPSHRLPNQLSSISILLPSPYGVQNPPASKSHNLSFFFFPSLHFSKTDMDAFKSTAKAHLNGLVGHNAILDRILYFEALYKAFTFCV